MAKTTAYQQHKSRWKGCRLCQLCDQRKRVCLARGSVPATVLFVGEAPGASEDVTGKPFMGPAGKLLDLIIERSEPTLLPEDHYTYALTNLVGCFPREAKQDPDSPNEPPDWAIESCAPRLEELARLCQPELVVAVGKLSKKWLKLLFPKGLGEQDGISLVHPAAILRTDVSQRGLAIQRSIVTLADAVGEF